MIAQERKGIVGIFLNNVYGELEVHVRLMFIQREGLCHDPVHWESSVSCPLTKTCSI